MSARRRVLVVGGGINGLVAAAYLARAGRDVTVLERSESVGGHATTLDVAPGFRASATFPGTEQIYPRIVEDLELPEHGFQPLAPGGLLVVGEGDDHLLAQPTPDAGGLAGSLAAAVRPRSGADADALTELDDLVRRVAEAMTPVYSRPLVELPPRGLGTWLDLLGIGWQLRGLGSEALPQALRFVPMSIADVVEERFEDPLLHAAIAGEAIRAVRQGPRAPGTAYTLLHYRVGTGQGVVAPVVAAAGGTGNLAEAIAGAARAAGAEIRTGAEVRAIVVDGGAARGVLLADGSELGADTVVSSLDPITTLERLVDTPTDPELADELGGVRATGCASLVHYALGGLPELRCLSGAAEAREALAGRVQLAAAIDELERASDALKYGEWPERPVLDLTVPTVRDATLAPEGKHVLSAWVHYTPWSDDGADGGAEALLRRVTARIDEVAPGFAGLVEDAVVLTPSRLEARFGAHRGCLTHVEMALDQALYLRPSPLLSSTDTPIAGLQLCGSGTHAGGGPSGLPGYNGAQRTVAR